MDGRCADLSDAPPTAGEARAGVHAASFALVHGWSSVELEGDCIQVINAIKEGDPDNLSDAGTFIADLASFRSSFIYFSCSFIRRSGNALAHSLTHLDLVSSFYVEGVQLPAGLA